jgi:hypothetical protein
MTPAFVVVDNDPDGEFETGAFFILNGWRDRTDKRYDYCSSVVKAEASEYCPLFQSVHLPLQTAMEGIIEEIEVEAEIESYFTQEIRPMLLPASWGLFIRDDLAEKLRNSDLTGYRLLKCIQGNPIPPGLPQEFFYVGHTYRIAGIERKPRIHIPPHNSCPFCGWSPIVCPGCNHVFSSCKRCERLLFVSKSNPDGPFKNNCDYRTIIELCNWKGEDFLTPNVVTSRVIQYFKEWNAEPMHYVEVKANIAGTSELYRDKYEDLKKVKI